MRFLEDLDLDVKKADSGSSVSGCRVGGGGKKVLKGKRRAFSRIRRHPSINLVDRALRKKDFPGNNLRSSRGEDQ
jgi:hypothetical protein